MVAFIDVHRFVSGSRTNVFHRWQSFCSVLLWLVWQSSILQYISIDSWIAHRSLFDFFTLRTLSLVHTWRLRLCQTQRMVPWQQVIVTILNVCIVKCEERDRKDQGKMQTQMLRVNTFILRQLTMNLLLRTTVCDKQIDFSSNINNFGCEHEFVRKFSFCSL